MKLESLIYAVTLLVPLVSGFASVGTRQHPKSTSLLRLRPDQGAELALAFENVVCSGQNNHPDCSAMHPKQNGIVSTVGQRFRGLVRRVVQVPVHFLHFLHHMQHLLDHDDDDEDVVLYPVLGFTFVKDRPNHDSEVKNDDLDWLTSSEAASSATESTT